MASTTTTTSTSRVVEIEEDENPQTVETLKPRTITLQKLGTAVGQYCDKKDITMFSNDLKIIMTLFLHNCIRLHRTDKDLNNVEECRIANDNEIYLEENHLIDLLDQYYNTAYRVYYQQIIQR